MMDISIVIPTYKRNAKLNKLLDSIIQQHAEDIKFEVILVSNLKDAYFQSAEFQQLVGEIDFKLLCVNRVGANRARNKGIRAASGQICVLLDDDCYLDDVAYLAKILDIHKRYPEALAIGGVYSESDDYQPIDVAYHTIARYWQSPARFGDYQSTRLVGGNVSYKTERLLALGELFDEEIEYGGTEAEFHQRLARKSQQMLCFDFLKVRHHTQLDEAELVKKAYRQAQAKSRYDIDDGFSHKDHKSYQSKKLLWVHKKAKDSQHFSEIVHFVNLYDWAYNLSLEQPTLSERKVTKKARQWSKSERQKLMEVVR